MHLILKFESNHYLPHIVKEALLTKMYNVKFMSAQDLITALKKNYDMKVMFF